MFTYSYYIYSRRENAFGSYNNTIHTTWTMPSDTGPAFMIVVHERRGIKYQKGGPGEEVVRDDVSNKKQRKITK